MTKINLPRTARQFEFSDKHFCRALIPEFAPAENSASARHADPNVGARDWNRFTDSDCSVDKNLTP